MLLPASEYLARAAELKSEATALADQAALARMNPHAAARAEPAPATPTSDDETSASVTETAGQDANITKTARAAEDAVEEPGVSGRISYRPPEAGRGGRATGMGGDLVEH